MDQLTAIQLLCLMQQKNMPLSELTKVMKKVPQVMENVKVSPTGKLRFYTNQPIEQAIEQAKKQLGEGGRVLVRLSGTEPLIRVMVEGEKKEEIQQIATDLAGVIATELAD